MKLGTIWIITSDIDAAIHHKNQGRKLMGENAGGTKYSTAAGVETASSQVFTQQVNAFSSSLSSPDATPFTQVVNRSHLVMIINILNFSSNISIEFVGTHISYFIIQNQTFWVIFQHSVSTLFENCSKCHILILAFSTNFCPIKTDRSGNTV